MDQLTTTRESEQVFLRRDALAAGYTDRDIARLVARGEWHRIRHGAYVAGALWQSFDAVQRHALTSRAVLIQARTPLVLSHLSAMPEYGGPMWGVPLDVVHVTRRDRRAGRKEAGVRQHQGILLPGDVEIRNGVEVTAAPRTAIDVTTVAGVEQSLAMINHLLHEGFTTIAEIRQRYTTMDKHPFTLATDLVLRLADGRIESVGESRVLYLMWRHGVPRAEPQLVVTDHSGREIARLDFAWPERKRWLEFDGREKYLKHLRPGESVADAVLREKRREDMIREITGWRCIRITWADLYHPERLAERILAFLG
jgi:hypothetical protein